MGRPNRGTQFRPVQMSTDALSVVSRWIYGRLDHGRATIRPSNARAGRTLAVVRGERPRPFEFGTSDSPPTQRVVGGCDDPRRRAPLGPRSSVHPASRGTIAIIDRVSIQMSTRCGHGYSAILRAVSATIPRPGHRFGGTGRVAELPELIRHRSYCGVEVTEEHSPDESGGSSQ